MRTSEIKDSISIPPPNKKQKWDVGVQVKHEINLVPFSKKLIYLSNSIFFMKLLGKKRIYISKERLLLLPALFELMSALIVLLGKSIGSLFRGTKVWRSGSFTYLKQSNVKLLFLKIIHLKNSWVILLTLFAVSFTDPPPAVQKPTDHYVHLL